jgi:hypothetical protein
MTESDRDWRFNALVGKRRMSAAIAEKSWRVMALEPWNPTYWCHLQR